MDWLVAKIQAFVRELRRRRVIRVAVVYGTTGFVILEAADILQPALRLPSWTVRLIAVLLILGFPLAIGLAWVYNLTDEGVVEVEDEAAFSEASEKSTVTSNVLIVGLLVVAIGLLLYPRMFSSEGPAVAGTTVVPDRSIAVLPFEPLSAAEKSTTFARGIHDDLLTRLANISAFTVISRTAVEKYRETNLTTGQIADSLGVRWVMEGGVQVLGDRIQVNAQLIDPRNEAHIWADDYQRDLTAETLFAMQGEITREIADALKAQLTAGEQECIVGAPTENLRAYRLYVKGRSHLNTRTPEGVAKAVKYFRQAIRQDSSYALSWSGLADAVRLYPTYGPDSLEAPDIDSKKPARRALSLDPDLAEAHTSLGHEYYGQHNIPAALQHLRRAVKLKPSYAQGHHWLGMCHLIIGRLDAAYENLQLAVDLAPGLIGARSALIATLIGEGKVDAAAFHLRQSSYRLPVWGGILRAAVLHDQGRWEPLRAWAMEEATKGRPLGHQWARFYLAHIAVRQGDTTRARTHLQRLRDRETSDPFFVGLVHAAMGQSDDAFAAREKKQNWEIGPSAALRYWYPDVLGPLRTDPRYDQLVQDVNRQWGMNPSGTMPQPADSLLGIASEADA